MTPPEKTPNFLKPASDDFVSPAPKITLRNIAAELKVTPMTVSRALRNQPGVSEELREQIQKTARKMGYEPDPMLTALAKYRHEGQSKPVRAALAWINGWKPPQALRKLHEFDLYWQGATEAALKHGYHLEEFLLNEDTSLSRLEKILLARNIRGILIPPQPESVKIDWRSVHWEHFAAVRFCGAPLLKANTCLTISTDAVANTLMAFDEIHSRGYRKIGFASHPGRTNTALASYLWAQQELSAEMRLPPFLIDQQTLRQQPELLYRWLKRSKPDAILTDKAELPELLANAGYRVPEDIGLATFSVMDGNISAGIYANSRELGRVAVLAVISLISDNSLGIPPIHRHIAISGRWVDGVSLPKRTLASPEVKRAGATR